MEVVRTWPNWLRWALVLPSAVVALLGTTILILLLNSMDQYSPQIFVNIYCQIIVGWTAPFAYIWVGSRMAPKNNGVTSVILATSFSVFLIFVLIFSLYYVHYSQDLVFNLNGTVLYIIRLVLGIISMIISCREAFEFENFQSDNFMNTLY